MSGRVDVEAVPGIAEVGEGDSIGELIAAAAARASVAIADSDGVVVSQKIVSKAEGRIRELTRVRPGKRAVELARQTDRDPRLVELILAESRRVVRASTRALIVETHSGWICANAGIDGSNVPGDETVALLPPDCDRSARRIRAELELACSRRPAVIVADSFGRPWRLGQTEVALGCAGLVALDDWRGRVDAQGSTLGATAIAIADQLAAAADLARDKASATPVSVVRGIGRWRIDDDGPGAAVLQRDPEDDLFR